MMAPGIHAIDQGPSSQQFALSARLVAPRRNRPRLRSHPLPAGREDDARACEPAGASIPWESRRSSRMARCASPKPARSSTISSSRYGKALEPAHGDEAHWRYRYWLHYAEGSLMPPLLLKLVVSRLGLLGWPAHGFVDGQIKLHLDYLENELNPRAMVRWRANSPPQTS